MKKEWGAASLIIKPLSASLKEVAETLFYIVSHRAGDEPRFILRLHDPIPLRSGSCCRMSAVGLVAYGCDAEGLWTGPCTLFNRCTAPSDRDWGSLVSIAAHDESPEGSAGFTRHTTTVICFSHVCLIYVAKWSNWKDFPGSSVRSG